MASPDIGDDAASSSHGLKQCLVIAVHKRINRSGSMRSDSVVWRSASIARQMPDALALGAEPPSPLFDQGIDHGARQVVPKGLAHLPLLPVRVQVPPCEGTEQGHGRLPQQRDGERKPGAIPREQLVGECKIATAQGNDGKGQARNREQAEGEADENAPKCQQQDLDTWGNQAHRLAL
jgi:hypothetical protein